jgi:hypothetical protein
MMQGATHAVPARLRAHLRTPLYRDGYALILSSGLTSVAGISHLNLMSALIRFIPAGHVTANLTKSERYGRHRHWVGRNVTAVLTEAVEA